MKQLAHILAVTLSTSCLFLLITLPAVGQQKEDTVMPTELFVPLTADTANIPPFRYENVVKWDSVLEDGTRHGTAPGGVSVSLRPKENPAEGWLVAVGARPGDVPNETDGLTLGRGGSVAVNLKHRPSDDYLGALRFVIKHEKVDGDDGDEEDLFWWGSGFRLTGVLEIGEFRARVMVHNNAGDGQFDLIHSTVGAIELNADGSRRRTFVAGSPIPIGEAWYAVHELQPNGSGVTLRRVDFVQPVIGQPLSSSEMVLSNGETYNVGPHEKPKIITFWAKWCPISVAQMDELDRVFRDQRSAISVLGINVDEVSRRHRVIDLIDQKDWTMPLVIPAKGAQEDLWLSFLSKEDILPAIPLYAVLDREGVLRYVGQSEISEVLAIVRELSK